MSIVTGSFDIHTDESHIRQKDSKFNLVLPENSDYIRITDEKGENVDFSVKKPLGGRYSDFFKQSQTVRVISKGQTYDGKLLYYEDTKVVLSTPSTGSNQTAIILIEDVESITSLCKSVSPEPYHNGEIVKVNFDPQHIKEYLVSYLLKSLTWKPVIHFTFKDTHIHGDILAEIDNQTGKVLNGVFRLVAHREKHREKNIRFQEHTYQTPFTGEKLDIPLVYPLTLSSIELEKTITHIGRVVAGYEKFYRLTVDFSSDFPPHLVPGLEESESGGQGRYDSEIIYQFTTPINLPHSEAIIYTTDNFISKVMVDETPKDTVTRLITGKTSKLRGELNITDAKEDNKNGDSMVKKTRIEGYVNNFLDTGETMLLRVYVGKREIASYTTSVGKTTRTGDYVSWTFQINAKSMVKIDNVINFK